MDYRFLGKTGLKNVEIIHDDGKNGYFPDSPYDCVLINVGCDSVPDLVVDQTKIFGRIVAPVNSEVNQELVLFQKTEEGRMSRTNLGSFVFVRMK